MLPVVLSRAARKLARHSLAPFAWRSISTPANHQFLLSATGPDRGGLVFEIAKSILDSNGDIMESRALRMGGDFSVMMRCQAATKDDLDSIGKKLSKLSSMNIVTHPVSPQTAPVPDPVFKVRFNLEAVNHPGLVYKVAEFFFSRGLRIDSLHTGTTGAPFGGTVLFLMDGLVVGDKHIDFKQLKEDSDALSSENGIELGLEKA